MYSGLLKRETAPSSARFPQQLAEPDPPPRRPAYHRTCRHSQMDQQTAIMRRSLEHELLRLRFVQELREYERPYIVCVLPLPVWPYAKMQTL